MEHALLIYMQYCNTFTFYPSPWSEHFKWTELLIEHKVCTMKHVSFWWRIFVDPLQFLPILGYFTDLAQSSYYSRWVAWIVLWSGHFYGSWHGNLPCITQGHTDASFLENRCALLHFIFRGISLFMFHRAFPYLCCYGNLWILLVKWRQWVTVVQ